MEEVHSPSEVGDRSVHTGIPRLTLEDTYGCRQSVVAKLEDSQRAEHDAVKRMSDIANQNTAQVLDILINWLSSGYESASQQDIGEISNISEVRYEEWLAVSERRKSAKFSLEDAGAKVRDAEAEYEALGPTFFPKPGRSDEDKARIRQAKARLEELRKDVDVKGAELRAIDNDVQLLGDKFLRSCCTGADRATTSSTLGKQLRGAIDDTAAKITQEWVSHCRQQQEGINEIERHLAVLKAVYAIKGEQS